MAMTVFMAMAMGVPCDGYKHAMFAGISMVLAVSSSRPCHSQGKCHGESHDLGKSQSKGFVVAREMSLAKVSDCDCG